MSEKAAPARGRRPARATPRAEKPAQGRARGAQPPRERILKRDIEAARRAGFEPAPSAPTGTRRPVSHAGGKVEHLTGSAELARAVEHSLSVDPERGVRDHVHGFHSYPARLHPVTAARLIEKLSPARGIVADPFCGSGTVLVEARRLGRRAMGVDLNPLAVRLSRFKTLPLAAAERAELEEAALRVAEHAEERRLEAAGPSRRYAPDERSAFEVHVLLELDGLAHGIKEEPAGPIRRALQLALSSIFSKVARVGGGEGPSKRLASGFTIRFFEGRVRELARELAEYEKLLPPKPPAVVVREADARDLAALGLENVDLFVSSPPYPGVLDYADYHRTRLRWLGLDATKFEQNEMGARRTLQGFDHERAAAAWEGDFTKVLGAMRKALAKGGHVALILADSMLGGRPYLADQVVVRCSERSGLAVEARGSQRRPHFHRESAKAFGIRPRYEHLFLLARK